MKIFIELWKANKAWKELPVKDRQEYVAQIGPVMEELMSKGLEIVAWGFNEDQTEFKSDFDFYAVSKLPSQELLDAFENAIEAAGWYHYFEQVNVSGSPVTPDEVIGKMLQI